jgi:hypothetical protein
MKPSNYVSPSLLSALCLVGHWLPVTTAFLLLGAAAQPSVSTPSGSISLAPAVAQPDQDSFDPPLEPPAPGIEGHENSGQPAIAPSSPASPATILSPTADQALNTATTTVTLEFDSHLEIELWVNNRQINADQVGQTTVDSSRGRTQQIWYGVVLDPGENRLEVRRAGQTTALTQTVVQVGGKAVTLQLTPVESRVPADGRSTVTIQGELLDAQGNPSAQRAVVTLLTTQGQFLGDDAYPEQSGFQVRVDQGQFTATLQSNLMAGAVRIRALSSNLEAFTQVSFETELRPTLLTGVVDLRLGARGTDFYGSFRDFLPADGDNRTQLDLRGAAFAVGSLGDWRFTGALRTDRALNQACDGTNTLFRPVQDCDRTYPTYGDNSTHEVLAPSTDSLYLRLERTSPVPDAGVDHVMWGDYRTPELATSSQQFSAIARNLYGFSANYNLGNLQLTGLYANNLQGFQRDTLSPDGTSGFYFLSRRLLVPGSESVFLEWEELNRPGTVVRRQSLSRGPDYEIDYDRGTLRFRQPILRTALGDNNQILIQRIVATYQYEGESGGTLVGGRLRYHLDRNPTQPSWLGSTFVQENRGSQQFQLIGADALISFGTTGNLIAEAAQSRNSLETVRPVQGEAYRVEVQNAFTPNLAGRAYWQSVSPGFTNNATTSFVPGQTRYGAEVQAQVSDTTRLRVQVDHEDNYGVAPRPLDDLRSLIAPGTQATPGAAVDNSLTTVSAGLTQQLGDGQAAVDWIYRNRTDRIAPETWSGSSHQVRSQLRLPISDRLTFNALNETTIIGDTDSLSPNRSLLGLDWRVLPGVNLGVTHQILDGGQFERATLNSLNLSAEHTLGSDTRLFGRTSLFDQGGMAGSVGINQGISLTPGLRMDLGLEHVFSNDGLITAAGSQFAQPYAVGQAASGLGVTGGTSYTVGLAYSGDPLFQADARLEHRTSGAGSNTVISANARGQLTPALTAVGHYHQARSANPRFNALGDTVNLRLGLAYRDPDSDVFNGLLRYEFRQNPATIPETLLIGAGTGAQEHLLALEGIYAPSWQWELYGKFAVRHSTSYLAADLVGASTISLAQMRGTYRLGESWDLVGEARWLSQGSTGYSETGFALEASYYLSPQLRLSGGYSFGRAHDRDLSRDRSASGPYLGLTLKLDNQLLQGFGQTDPSPPPVPLP